MSKRWLTNMRNLIPLLLLAAVFAAGQGTVPTAYQTMYSTLDSNVSTFASAVDAGWDHSRYPVAFSAELTSASSFQGQALLTDGYINAVKAELDSLQAVGVKAVTVQISYPVLDPGFYGKATAQYQAYVDFYNQVTSEIRSRNLTYIVEAGIIFSQQGFTTVNPQQYYAGQTLAQYEAGRIGVIRTVLQQFRPDYLVPIQEPDTEAVQSGKAELGTVAGSTAFLQAILTAKVQTGVPGVKIGAGIGTWLSPHLPWIQSYAATSVDFIDLHIYPGVRDYLTKCLQIADVAHSYGKDVAISEAWLNKELDAELGIVSNLTLFGRNPFSFWAPLDQKFLQAFVNYSQSKRLLFFTPLWSQYMHLYLNYATTAQLAPTQIMYTVATTLGQSVAEGKFSATGVAYAAMIAMTRDTTAPSVPTAPSVLVPSATELYISWNPSSDNVGVAGYAVYRNGAPVGTSGTTHFQDSGLRANTSYTYSIIAYDIMGNASGAATVVGTTNSAIDHSSPSTPTGLVAQALTSTQVEVIWNASTDNVWVAGYKVYRNGAQVAQTVFPSFSDWGLSPGTAYTYTVAAFDSAGNVSAQSAAARVTTFAIDKTPPSTPSFYAQAGKNIVYTWWTPATDDVAVGGYNLYRNGVLLTRLAGMSYNDTSVAPSTTYTYAVTAYDTAGNVSPASNMVTVTTPDTVPPSVPTSLAGTALSSTQVKLTWVASTDNIRVAGYRIYRNGAKVADYGLTTYTDSGLSPSTVYTYTVAAIDSSGNISKPSAPALVLTKAK